MSVVDDMRSGQPSTVPGVEDKGQIDQRVRDYRH
jgi:hypothetical protein